MLHHTHLRSIARRCLFAVTVAALAVLAGVLVPSLGQAASPASNWERTEFADVRLVSAVAGTKGRDTVPLGLEFRLAEGWKVYWRAPGDAGYPPEVNWDGSANLGGSEMRYPVPSRFSIFGLESYGYKDQVVYPIDVKLSEPGAALAVMAEINALACAEICVPLTANLSLDLPNTEAKATPFTQLIGRWQSRVPVDLSGIDMTVASAQAVGDPTHPTLELLVRSDLPFEALDVFPEAATAFSFGKPELVSTRVEGTVLLRVPVGVKGEARLDGAPVTLTLVDGDRFVERSVIVGETGAATSSPQASAGLGTMFWILGLSVLGGLILNLMPCVLPVLSLKLLGVVSYGGAERGVIRVGFLASAAGIVVSFLLLAGAAVGLKAAGVAVGWGIQFQQPVFLALMAALVTAFAANLAGGFEVPLPRFLARLGEGGVGQADHRQGLAKHFGTGMLATLLATPCSAPFVGTAIGFALARGPVEIFAVFGAMGLGLALPYLAVAAAPGLARAMPRPGAWMLWVKRVLALALGLTALWLVSVISAQAGLVVAGSVGVALIALLVVLMLGGRLGGAVTFGGAVIALVAAVMISGFADRIGSTASSTTDDTAQSVPWVAFDRAALPGMVADGRVVLVDVTADWCITCKVNKRLVLEADPIAGVLSGADVVPVRADWTNPDPVISDYLAGFGRYGIPFNAVYGPGAPDGVPLPELLTQQAVLEAIEVARGAVKAGSAAQPTAARLD
jgi:suppressor for copper-sensitivity B